MRNKKKRHQRRKTSKFMSGNERRRQRTAERALADEARLAYELSSRL